MADPARGHRGGRLEEAAKAAIRAAPSPIPWQFHLRNPGACAEKIICVGVNFPDRNAEYKDGQEAPPNMSLFIRFPRSFTGHECR
jgi:2-keto-4-pentenoate hydratase/2-oxohepta-3-ene-1,7-dioic acid hydratase in catechol pathway